jgi:hypothetical protein
MISLGIEELLSEAKEEEISEEVSFPLEGEEAVSLDGAPRVEHPSKIKGSRQLIKSGNAFFITVSYLIFQSGIAGFLSLWLSHKKFFRHVPTKKAPVRAP